MPLNGEAKAWIRVLVGALLTLALVGAGWLVTWGKTEAAVTSNCGAITTLSGDVKRLDKEITAQRADLPWIKEACRDMKTEMAEQRRMMQEILKAIQR